MVTPKVSGPDVRRALSMVLRTASDLDAFLLDCFPAVYHRLSNGMDRTTRENLLLSLTAPAEVFKTLYEQANDGQKASLRQMLNAAADPMKRDDSAEIPKEGPKTTAVPQVYVEYAAQDRDLVEKLFVQLAPLVRKQSMQLLHRGNVPVGAHTANTLATWMQTAQVIVVMLSADLLNGEDFEVFLQQALKRQTAGVVLVPVLLRPVLWQETELKPLQILPMDGLPISTRTGAKLESVLAEVAGELAKLVGRLAPHQKGS